MTVLDPSPARPTIGRMMLAVAAASVLLGLLRTAAGPIASIATGAILMGFVAPAMAHRSARRLDRRLVARGAEVPRTDRHVIRVMGRAAVVWLAWFAGGYLVAVLGVLTSLRLRGRS